MNITELKSRAIEAAEEILEREKVVTPVEVLLEIGRLVPSHIEQWQHGRIQYLEEMIQGRPDRIRDMLAALRQWALDKHLVQGERRYVRHSREGDQELRFTAEGDQELELQLYRTSYTSPALSQVKRAKLEEKASRPKQPVVFDNLRASKCTECGVEIGKGDFLYMEGGNPLCLACGGFSELEFLPAGDTALTRRSGKYSKRTAVVVRFSRSRGRYERQGLLVEPEALAQAEGECAEDAGERAQARLRAAEARERQDRELAQRMAGSIRELFPGCPPGEARAIALHTAQRGSGRIGRTAAGQALDEQALRLAVRAAIRHQHTNYDELLAGGADRELARARVQGRVAEVLEGWERPAGAS